MSAAYECNGKPISAAAFYAIACDPRRSVAVEACAGAGKTWMLVSRIIRALLEGSSGPDGQAGGAGTLRPHEILAITFTKKAAGEMRERLHAWLQKFTHSDDATLGQELLVRGVPAELATGPQPALRRQLSALYRSLLADGRSVQIRTFHSWFAALLRTAPIAVLHRLGLPVHYQLLEDDAPARALVWRRFYAALVAEPALRADFEALVLAHGRSSAHQALQAALDKRTEFLLADEQGVVDTSVMPFELLFPQFAGLARPEDALQSLTKRQIWLERARLLAAEKNKTPKKAAAAIVGAFATDDMALRCSQLRKAFFVADADRLNANLVKFAAAQDAEVELQALCRARAQHAAWHHQQRMARLTRLLIGQYSQLKQDNSWVDMNDVERAALALLSDPVLSGWVQERLDARVRHLLIDEFQDTNPLQWQALSSWLSGYGGAGSAPSVFLVGDPKQSIYRFRRAEPQVFRAAQAFIVGGLGGDLLSCDHTWRNSQVVIGVVNAAMEAASANDCYDGFRRHTSDSPHAGAAARLPQIERLPASTPLAAGAAAPWRDSLVTPREVPEETLQTLEARQAAAWVAGRIAAGSQPSEVMVLARRRSALLPLQQALQALQIPAQVGEKIKLIECCEVQDIVALLDVLVSPQHDLSLARALRSPIFDVTDAGLVVLALLKRKLQLPWHELLQHAELPAGELQGLGSTLARWKEWLDRLPPHDALQAIYDDGDLLARFVAAAPAVRRPSVLANLQSLLGIALNQGGGRYATPYALVRVLKAGGTQAPASANQLAVRLLTIHGAKGLEADAVLLLDTDQPQRNADSMGVLIDWPGELAAPRKFVFMVSETQPPACAQDVLAVEQAARLREELNALYVAMTRARHTLAISSIAAHRSAPGSWWMRLQGLVGSAADGITIASTPDQPAPGFVGGSANAACFQLLELPPFNMPPVMVPTATPPSDEDGIFARIGKAMHRLLEWGGQTSGEHLSAVAREFCISPAQAVQAGQLARCILHGQAAWAWQLEAIAWAGNEVGVVYQGQPLRLDRLVLRRDAGHHGEWWVLDYKTAHAPELQLVLLEKMRTYRAAVRLAYPGTTVRAAFLTGQGTIIEVS